MSQRGLLPNAAASDWITPGQRREQRLLNQRTLDSLRPQSVQRALLPQLLTGLLVGFSETDRVDGPRPMLSLHVERDKDRPVRHVASLSAVRTDNRIESDVPSGDRLAGTPIHVAVGGGGSAGPDLEMLGVDLRTAKGQWHSSYARTNTDVRTASVTERIHAPVVSAAGVDVYAVPAWLYAESEGDRPIQGTVKTPVTVHVAVPAHRTTAEPPSSARPEDATRTGGLAARSAGLSTADAGEVLQHVHVESVAGSHSLAREIAKLLGVEQRTTPARNLAEDEAPARDPDGAEGAAEANEEAADAERNPLLTGAPATSRSRVPLPIAGQWLTTQLSGVSLDSRANLLHSRGRQALDPARLVADAQTVFGGGLVMEAGMGEGRITGTRVRITVEGSLHGLHYAGPVGAVEHRRSLATTQGAATTRTITSHSGPQAVLSGDLAPLEAISSDLQLSGHPPDSTVRTLNDATTTHWMVSAGSSPMHRIHVTVQTARDGVLPTSFSADRNTTVPGRVIEPDGVELLVTDDELHRLRNVLDDDSIPAPEVTGRPGPTPPAVAPTRARRRRWSCRYAPKAVQVWYAISSPTSSRRFRRVSPAWTAAATCTGFCLR
ncbi:hypothetical protein [Streptomyces olivaceoviridis]|uniref:hypothetical protein n=1 Tax=Streptomyces olivaceoviridis TaxID=1921 RepID=UPI003316B8E9